MFDKLKQLHELKKLQDEFKKETATVEKEGISVTMTGNMDVEEIKLNPELDINQQAQLLKHCLSEAKDTIQKKLAQKMMNSGLKL